MKTLGLTRNQDMTPTLPDYSTAESDRIFRQVRYYRSRGKTYVQAWQALLDRAANDRMFANDLQLAIQTHIPKERQ